MEKSEYGFRKLIESSDKKCREEIGDYYIISESRMENIIHCLESGAKEISNLREELVEEKRLCTIYKNELENWKDCQRVIENLTTQVEMLRKE